ncbi:MAG: MBL fold metallo-hydrolase [Planctomycetaceae bacterium]|nr:MBL fold metallo-hydrolase [Planctomycetaceae bacterium]
MTRMAIPLGFFLLLLAMTGQLAQAAEGRKFEIYFIDVEGGAATFLVTPAGETILIDSGYPDLGGRDRDRILDVVRNVAGETNIDHAVVSHWHRDHYGNHAALAAEIPIGVFWDRGIPDALQEDNEFQDRIAEYRSASQNQSRPLKAGDTFVLDSGDLPLKVTVLSGSREVIQNSGPPNPFADEADLREEDSSDNAASLSLLFQYGDFEFLCCGDLTWNVEAKLVTPNNSIGKVDLFMVTHHGLPVSNNPVLVKAIDPLVAVMCNGPTKGGHPQTISTLRACESLKHWYQLHRNIALADEEQAPREFIANTGTTQDCQGVWVKASVALDGKSFAVQVGPDGQRRTYDCRPN